MQQAPRGQLAPLDAVYRDLAGAPTDPIGPLVDILNPSFTVVANDVVPVITTPGLADYPGGGYLVAADAPLGVWTARWTGTVGGSAVEAFDEFEVVIGPVATAAGPALATLTEYEALYGNAGNDARVETALGYASAAVRKHMGGRVDAVSGEQVFLDGNGSNKLWLADYPVTAVASVIEAGIALVVDVDYRWRDYGELERLSGTWPAGVRNVAVTYSHASDRLTVAKGVVLAAAHRAVTDMAADPEGSFVPTAAVALTQSERDALGARLVVG